jgi:hypothetical protein
VTFLVYLLLTRFKYPEATDCFVCMPENSNSDRNQVCASLQIDEQIERGDGGTVYSINWPNATAVKILDKETRDESRVQAMLNNTPSDPAYRQRGIRSLAWPTAILNDRPTGAFCGYAMPHDDSSNPTPALEYARGALAWDRSAERDRYKTALNLAVAVKAIHDEGHAIGDFDHGNILVEDGFVMLIDCERFHISGESSSYPCRGYPPRYVTPERRGDTLTDAQRADKFALAIHIFQFLLEGTHPYRTQGSDTADTNWSEIIDETSFPYANSKGHLEPVPGVQQKYNQLPTTVRTLFERCFDSISENTLQSCPEPRKWITTLKSEFKSKSPGDSDRHTGDDGSDSEGTNEDNTDSASHPAVSGTSTTGAGGGTDSPVVNPYTDRNEETGQDGTSEEESTEETGQDGTSEEESTEDTGSLGVADGSTEITSAVIDPYASDNKKTEGEVPDSKPSEDADTYDRSEGHNATDDGTRKDNSLGDDPNEVGAVESEPPTQETTGEESIQTESSGEDSAGEESLQGKENKARTHRETE